MFHFFVGNVDETQTRFVKSHDSSSVNHDVIDDESELPWAMYRSLDPVFKNEDEQIEKWNVDDDLDDYGKQTTFIIDDLISF